MNLRKEILDSFTPSKKEKKCFIHNVNDNTT